MNNKQIMFVFRSSQVRNVGILATSKMERFWGRTPSSFLVLKWSMSAMMGIHSLGLTQGIAMRPVYGVTTSQAVRVSQSRMFFVKVCVRFQNHDLCFPTVCMRLCQDRGQAWETFGTLGGSRHPRKNPSFSVMCAWSELRQQWKFTC